MVNHKVKVVYRDEIYKASVKGYEEIIEYVNSNVLQRKSESLQFKLRYRDSDGDDVILRSEKDFDEAVDDHEGPTLKLSLEILAQDADVNVAGSNEAKTELDEHDSLIDLTKDRDETLQGPPPAKKAKIVLEQLQKICKTLSSEHEQTYGVPCAYQVQEEEGVALVYCPFCKTCIRPQKGKEMALQPFRNHGKRISHRSNVHSVVDRDQLSTEKFDDVELREIQAQRFLDSTSPGVFDVTTSGQGTLVLQCRYCGPKGIIKLNPKSSSLETSVKNHIGSKQHYSARKGGVQSTMSAYLSQSSNSPSNSHK